MQMSALGAVLDEWVKVNPQSAARALDHLEPGARVKLLPAMAAAYGEANPAAALDWAQGLSSIDRIRGVNDVIKGWAAKDAPAAAAAVQGFVWEIGRLDPPVAARWADSIGSTGMRRNALHGVLGQWRTGDPAAARAFADGINPPELRQEMLRLLAE
jgi:hypothetical protein